MILLSLGIVFTGALFIASVGFFLPVPALICTRNSRWTFSRLSLPVNQGAFPAVRGENIFMRVNGLACHEQKASLSPVIRQ
jgi:hypothetical protein